MRYVITAIVANENDEIAITTEEATVVNSPSEVLDYIASSELTDVGFDISTADGDEDSLTHLQQVRSTIDGLLIRFNGLTPVTISSPWAGPAKEGGIDWIVLPLAA